MVLFKNIASKANLFNFKTKMWKICGSAMDIFRNIIFQNILALNAIIRSSRLPDQSYERVFQCRVRVRRV